MAEGINLVQPPAVNLHTNALQINTVVKCLFGYLDLHELKKLRKVNKMWNAVAAPLIRKRSKIKFGPIIWQGRQKARTPRNYFEEFVNPGTTLPFTSFLFTRGVDYPIAELTHFFVTQKSFITELEINSINLIGEDGKQLETYDIGPWIENAPITKFVARRAFNFNEADDNAYHPTQLIIPLHHLTSIQHLTMRDYRFTFQKGIRLSPKTLLIAEVALFYDGIHLSDCCVNKFIDFKQTTEIMLSSSKRNFPSTTLILDFGEDFIANEVILVENTRAVNWKISRCYIETLHMYEIPIVEKNLMRVKNLKFGSASMDLAALPKTLEKLTFLTLDGSPSPIICSEPITLPKLSYLMLDLLYARIVEYLVNCSNLVEIAFYASRENIPRLDLNLIPKSVKRLKMPGRVSLHGEIDVNALILDPSSLRSASRILTHVNTNMLGVALDDQAVAQLNETLIPFLLFIEDITLYIGRIQSVSPIQNLDEYVDILSDYYVFHNQSGRAISGREFRQKLYPAPEDS